MVTKRRTEDDRIFRAPITVVLGGAKYDVTPLVIRDSREWRRAVTAALSSFSLYTKVTSGDPELFKKTLSTMLVETPDKVIDLFFDYAKDLDRGKIEAAATDAEIAKAFEQVVELAFPLAKSLVGTMTKISQ